MYPHQPRHVAVAVLTLFGMHAAAWADTTSVKHQERVGLALNVPFSGQGVLFKQATVSLVYQQASVRESGRVAGWQVSIGSGLQSFSPVFAVAGLAGERCGQGSIGVSYGAAGWGLPVALQGPHVQVGLANTGGIGGAFAGVSTLGCFKRYEPAMAAAPAAPVVVPPPPPQPPSSSGPQNSVDA
ncbi:MAG: hypothetical protein EOP40_19285, partial [Rubrivivax sp.]